MNELVQDKEKEDLHCFYRSRLFTAKTGINPLTTAASALLTLMGQLNNHEFSADVNELHDYLSHETKAFMTQAEMKGYRSETVLIARYILCTAIDDIILANPWGQQHQWRQSSLVWTFHQETMGDDRFFLILEHLLQHASLHVDLLELCYLCLSLGYAGKYRDMAAGDATLNATIDILYQRIREHRGFYQRPLLTTPPQNLDQKNNNSRLSFWHIMLTTGILLLLIYMFFNTLLSLNTKPLYREIITIDSQLGQGNEDR